MNGLCEEAIWWVAAWQTTDARIEEPGKKDLLY